MQPCRARFSRRSRRIALYRIRGVITRARALEQFEHDTWWFRCEFNVPPDATGADAYVLVLEGVSLLCTVWVNGSPVEFTHNAHHAHRVDITRFVRRDGTNVVALECRLGIDAARRRVCAPT